MTNTSSRRMFIYISGPYSAPNEPEASRASKIAANIDKADEEARKIANKGHFPFLPHTMMRGWEDIHHFDRARALNICKNWVQKCDALYLIPSSEVSEGAEQERQVAVELNLPIYRNLNDIPDAAPDSHSRLSADAVKIYLIEYHECMESYRHTYATIWQAGSIFAAVSAAIIAFANKSNDGAIPWWIQLLAPMPVLFWWRGIYSPMNRYGEQRSTRLKDIEELLSAGGAAPDLQMQHFRDYDQERKGNPIKNEGLQDKIKRYWKTRIKTKKFITQPRVVEVVTIFGLSVLGLEIMLIIKNWSELTRWFKSF